MYETMEATNGYAAIVFVFIVIAGQFIVLNIFLAVVLAVNGLERRVELQRVRLSLMACFEKQVLRLTFRKWRVSTDLAFPSLIEEEKAARAASELVLPGSWELSLKNYRVRLPLSPLSKSDPIKRLLPLTFSNLF